MRRKRVCRDEFFADFFIRSLLLRLIFSSERERMRKKEKLENEEEIRQREREREKKNPFRVHHHQDNGSNKLAEEKETNGGRERNEEGRKKG